MKSLLKLFYIAVKVIYLVLNWAEKWFIWFLLKKHSIFATRKIIVKNRNIHKRKLDEKDYLFSKCIYVLRFAG